MPSILRKNILLIILAFLNLVVYAWIPDRPNQAVVDSLLRILPGIEGKGKVDILNKLSFQLAPRSFDSSYMYASEAHELSEKLEYSWGRGVATFNLGNSNYFKLEIKNALLYYLDALRILESFGPSRELGDLLLQLGAVNDYVRNPEKAKAFYRRSAQNYNAIGDTIAYFDALRTIGNSYFAKVLIMEAMGSLNSEENRRMIDTCLYYDEIAENLARIKGYDQFIAHISIDQGYYYDQIKDPRALAYFNKAMKLFILKNDSNLRNSIFGNALAGLGYYYYYHRGDADSGSYMCLRSIEYYKRTDRYDLYSRPCLTLGEIEMNQGRYISARKYFQLSLDLCDTFIVHRSMISNGDPTFRTRAITRDKAFRISTLDDLVALFEKTGDYKNALIYQKKLDEVKKLQNIDELNREIIGIESNYEDQIKRQQIDLLVKDIELRRMKLNQSRILYGGIGGVLLAGLLILLLWNQRKRSLSDRKALVMEQKLLRSQMNPHFIFNSLYSIQNFIVTEKPDKASIYLSKFAKLVRNILDNSTEELVPVEKEISTLENYLDLQKVRYAGKFDYRIDIDDDIDPVTIKIPPMLAQPFIENAIEHGIRHKEVPGHIIIRFSLKHQTLIFEVEDDGVGRRTAREIELRRDPEHKSISTSLTRERLIHLNRKLHKKIVLEIIDLEDTHGNAAGTKIRFGIPVF